MNNREMMKEVSRVSNVEEVKSAEILKAYEKYCEANVFKGSAKHMEAIVAYITEATSIDADEVQPVMEAFFKTLKKQMKNKIPFTKKEQ
jgi:hypothetical protein